MCSVDLERVFDRVTYEVTQLTWFKKNIPVVSVGVVMRRRKIHVRILNGNRSIRGVRVAVGVHWGYVFCPRILDTHQYTEWKQGYQRGSM